MEKINLTQVNDNESRWEFIRNLRNSDSVNHGFIETDYISYDQQIKYMSVHGKNYYIIEFKSSPIGYIGDVNKDIRICIHPDFQNKGYGTEAIKEFHKLFPDSLAKIKIDNNQSLKSFENAGYKITYFLLTKENDTNN
jgi:RimJ/RimL family protein N-acetyltransferase